MPRRRQGQLRACRTLHLRGCGRRVRQSPVGYVAAAAPLLVVASLTGRDDVDATTVSFFVDKKKD